MSSALNQYLKQLHEQKYESVHAASIEMIRQDVDNPLPYFLLGRIANEHKNRVKARELLERAQTLAPDNSFYGAQFAKYLVDTGDQAAALKVMDNVVRLPIDDAHTADTVGVVFSRTGFHERAVPFFEAAVKLDPSPANFHYNLAASLQFSGEFSGAEQAFDACIKRDPDAYRAYSSLASLSKQTSDKNYLVELKALFEKLHNNEDAALHLGHAIAKTYEDLDRHEDSFDWLVRAKKAKRAQINYQSASDLELFTAAAEHAKKGVVKAGKNHTNAAPIFVVGLPRTGTTLVDRILSSHPDVVSAGELNTFAGLIKSATGTTSNMVLDVETLSNIEGIDLAKIGQQYVSSTRRLARGANRFTDKMPLNFFYVAAICRAMPLAKVVILRRDPADSCLSNFRQLFSTGFSYYNYSLSIDDTARYYNAFDRLIAHWLKVLPKKNLHEIRYEDIVFDQENQTQQLLSFCDLGWDDNCMRFYENRAPVSTASSVQVRQPLYSGSVGRWKKYGDRLDSLREILGVDD